MKTIEANAKVYGAGQAAIEFVVPPDVPKGLHRAVVVLDEQPIDDAPPETTAFPVLDLVPVSFEGWPAGCTFRREDLYGDNGR